jgi:uncharacterized protein
MKIEECQVFLSAALSGTVIANPKTSPLGRSAESVLVMARAYESDGRTFFVTGDPVNALASFWYGFGWLHFGISCGLMTSPETAGCPFRDTCESLRPEQRPQLTEKTARYERLLDTARSSVECAPEPATGAYDFAERVLLIASVYAIHGTVMRKTGRDEDALAAFSYGHGWLDAGVTTGLFRITAHHEIFTV